MTELAIDPAIVAGVGSPAPLLPDAEALRRRLFRLAFDVHDGPMQSLAAVGYGLLQLRGLLRELLSANDTPEAAAAATQVELMHAELVTAEAVLRSLISTLEHCGGEIDSLDVIAASEIARFNRRCGALTEMIVQPDFWPDTHSQALAIGAILRESLTNIAKHAHAGEVLVRLLADHSEILLEVRDDGVGFDLGTIESGIGLASMRERVRLLSGTLTVESGRGGPTVITARLPRWQLPASAGPSPVSAAARLAAPLEATF